MSRTCSLLLVSAVWAMCMASPPSSASPAGDALKAQHQRADSEVSTRDRRRDAFDEAERARSKAVANLAALEAEGAASPRLEAARTRLLEAEEAATAARGALLGADAAVAREGARLLHLFEVVLAERRQALERASPATRPAQVAVWRKLRDQRDAVRRVISASSRPHLDGGASLAVTDADDADALLEKADLARDLEARLKRRVAQVRLRLQELREDEAVAADVAAAVARGQLFDEDDRRLVLRTGTINQTQAVALPGGDADPEAPNFENGSEQDNSGPPLPSTGGPGRGDVVVTLGAAERGYGVTPGQGVAMDDVDDVDSIVALEDLQASLAAELAKISAQRVRLENLQRTR